MKYTILASSIFNEAEKFRNYSYFIKSFYPQYEYIEDIPNYEYPDLYDELDTVEDLLIMEGASPEQVPIYWRDDYDYPIAKIGDKFYYIDWINNNIIQIESDENSLYELGLPEIEACNNIMSSESDCKYIIEDTYGAPQAGVDVRKFATYEELEEYLESHPDVEERMTEGYAIIKEC